MNTKKHSSITPFLFLALEKPVYCFLFALVIYFILSISGGPPFRVEPKAYFNYLADAFLHGQLYLRLMPPSLHDLSFFNGHYYLYWPPMPAIILMPFVAMFGVGFSDVFFNVVIASVNIGAVAALLRAAHRKGLVSLEANYRTALVVFFALGTVHVVLAPSGKVWFTSQLLGFLLVTLTYLCALELNGALSFAMVGTLIACAMLTRSHLLLTSIWPAYYLLTKNWGNRPKIYGYVILGLLPPLIAGILFLNYNFARFGNPLELGISYQHMSPVLSANYQKYGVLNIHYIPINLFYQYIHYPLLPTDNDMAMGGSLFLLSPVFFFAFRGIFRQWSNPNVRMLLISILTTNIPILLLMGTGWAQYGPRYTLDFTVPLLLVTAYGIRSASKRLLTWLIFLSIIQYIPGIILFARLALLHA